MHKIVWQAIYDDGERLSQYNGDGTENKYTDIDRSRLVQFILFEKNHLIGSGQERILGNPKVVIHLDNNKRLIYRHRVAMAFSGTKQGNQETVHLAGWQEKKQGTNTQMICFLFEDGHVEIVDRFYENHPWFYHVIFLSEEK